MPIPELQDYINIINNEKEKEKAEWNTTGVEEDTKPSSFRDIFGDVKNPLSI